MKSVMISFRVPLKSPIFEWITQQEADGNNVSQEIRSLILKEHIENNQKLFNAYMIQVWRYRRLMEYLPDDVLRRFQTWLGDRTWHETNQHETGWLHPKSDLAVKLNDNLEVRRRIWKGELPGRNEKMMKRYFPEEE